MISEHPTSEYIDENGDTVYYIKPCTDWIDFVLEVQDIEQRKRDAEERRAAYLRLQRG